MAGQLRNDHDLLEGEIKMDNAKQLLSKLSLLLLVPLIFILAMLTDIAGINFTRKKSPRVFQV